ncbi:MAG: hypothetical protein JWP89_5833 [Schlesneria sp.]|nr:hypothetical protein [Schlesneria sp.]
MSGDKMCSHRSQRAAAPRDGDPISSAMRCRIRSIRIQRALPARNGIRSNYWWLSRDHCREQPWRFWARSSKHFYLRPLFLSFPRRRESRACGTGAMMDGEDSPSKPSVAHPTTSDRLVVPPLDLVAQCSSAVVLLGSSSRPSRSTSCRPGRLRLLGRRSRDRCRRDD